MEQLFFNGWEGIIRVALTTAIAYILVILILRISGKRTLAKMNAFDFIVTIALGSILGAVILNKSIPLAEGLSAIVILVMLQYLITYITVRNKTFKKLISSDPTLLFYEGNLLEKAMKTQRISREEINKSVRAAGLADFENIFAIVIESTGDLTVVKKNNQSATYSAMNDVKIV